MWQVQILKLRLIEGIVLFIGNSFFFDPLRRTGCVKGLRERVWEKGEVWKTAIVRGRGGSLRGPSRAQSDRSPHPSGSEWGSKEDRVPG